MLKALLHHKLELRDRVFADWRGVEDLLTSIVFGACEYLAPEDALGPFLRTAEAAENGSFELRGVRMARYRWWRSHAQVADPAGGGVRGGEPELVIEIEFEDGERGFLAIEAKLRSGISAPATSAGYVSHQLAKYWLHLTRIAARENAEPLGVIYVTAHLAPFFADLDDAQNELRSKGVAPGRLFATTWHRIAAVSQSSTHAIVRDVHRLLETEYMLGPLRATWGWVVQTAPPTSWNFRFSWSTMAPESSWRFRR